MTSSDAPQRPPVFSPNSPNHIQTDSQAHKPQTSKPQQFILIIRFSSFGDIVQAIIVLNALKNHFPNARIDWLISRDFENLLRHHPALSQLWVFDRKKQGLWSLLKLAWKISQHEITHVYDAHNNLRSWIVIAVLQLSRLFSHKPFLHLVTRPKHRIRRILYFKLKIRSVFPRPFLGSVSFLEPLSAWGIPSHLSAPLPPPPQLFLTNQQELNTKISSETPTVTLVPSAAWAMKRWPLEHWKKLISLLKSVEFIILGGPEDLFCTELKQVAPERVQNLAGKLSLEESAQVLSRTQLVISGDTGLLHVADQLGIPNIALIGPTAFGYPSHPQSHVMQTNLECQPCSKDGRGKCRNSIYQRCLVELSPEQVAQKADFLLQQQAKTL